MQFPLIQKPDIEMRGEYGGVPYSRHYADKYFSEIDGWAESKAIYFRANDLPARWQGKNDFCVGELGFGSGLNFLMTYKAWQDDPQRPSQLYYVAIERAPVSIDIIRQIGHNWPALAPYAEELIAQFPGDKLGNHSLSFAKGAVRLLLSHGAADAVLSQWDQRVEAWYLDGFAPSRNPSLWDDHLFKLVARNSAEGATLASFTAAGAVRRGLQAAGFKISKQAGFAGKRERITGYFAPHNPKQGSQRREILSTDSHIYIIGGGVVGLHVAWSLRARGASQPITILDNETIGANACASNTPMAMVMPQISSEMTMRGLLHWQAYHYARAHYADLATQLDETMMQAVDTYRRLPPSFEDHEAEILQTSLAAYQVPADVAVLDHSAGTALWYFDTPLIKGNVLKARMRIALAAQDVKWITADVSALDQVLAYSDQHGNDQCIELSEQDQVILCSGAGLQKYDDALSVHTTRGQLSWAPADAESRQIDALYSRHIYASPPMSHSVSAELGHYLGATFDRQHTHLALDAEEAEKLQAQWLANCVSLPPRWQSGRKLAFETPVFAAIRLHTNDRTPLMGRAPDLRQVAAQTSYQRSKLRSSKPYFTQASQQFAKPQQWILGGMGSHGFTLAPFLADALAAELLGQPQSLQKELLRSLDPLWQWLQSEHNDETKKSV